MERLHGDEQETIFDFISRPDNQCNLHCVQFAESMLHTCPWVECKLWDNESIRASVNKLDDWLKSHILNSKRFEEIVVVSSAQSGSGKTKLILENLDHIKERDSNAQVATIVIHEGSTISNVVDTLCTHIKCESELKAVYFSLMTGLDAVHERLRELLNYVLESLILTGAIRDPENQKVFYCGAGKWSIYVETIAMKSAPDESVKDIMLQKIPILSCCASFIVPSNNYFIDEKARRVCTYLRAFDNGTIDRKFNAIPLKKQLLFVIDKSGSMQQQMANARTALDVAVDNALGILESHIQIDDVSVVFLFSVSYVISDFSKGYLFVTWNQ